MSYQLTVTAQGGELSVTHAGDVPDGSFEVGGHDDAVSRALTVAQRRPDGSYVAQASQVTYREA